MPGSFISLLELTKWIRNRCHTRQFNTLFVFRRISGIFENILRINARLRNIAATGAKTGNAVFHELKTETFSKDFDILRALMTRRMRSAILRNHLKVLF